MSTTKLKAALKAALERNAHDHKAKEVIAIKKMLRAAQRAKRDERAALVRAYDRKTEQARHAG